MPRVSLIIPYLHNDTALEDTLLSVLENRPEDCEILVVHDGTYHDPYQLDDEVTFVDGEPGASPSELINTALSVASAPLVHTLWPGIEVWPDWCQSALEELDETGGAAAALAVQLDDGSQRQGIRCGVAHRGAPWRQTHVDESADGVRGPMLQCAIYRRNVLDVLGGVPLLPADAASLALTAAIDALELTIIGGPIVGRATKSVFADSDLTTVLTRASILAMIQCNQLNLLDRCLLLLRGLACGQLAEARAWIRGTTKASAVQEDLQLRIDRARRAVESPEQPSTIRMLQSTTARRAA